MVEKISDNFYLEEFNCKCQDPNCRRTPVQVSLKLLSALENIRAHFGGKPMTIESGFRCLKYNNEVGGKPLSAHLTYQVLMGADVTIDGIAPALIQNYAFELIRKEKICGVGSAKGFTHLDVLPIRPARWQY